MMSVSPSNRKPTTDTSSSNVNNNSNMNRMSSRHRRRIPNKLFVDCSSSSSSSSFISKLQMTFLLLSLLLSFSSQMSVMALTMGNEKAFFTTPQMTPNVSHRQNVCDRYNAFFNKTVDLKDALTGLKLQVGIAAYSGAYFNYDPTTGIDRDYPGLTAVLLDELARRAKFTWRQSFGLTGDPADTNHTWQELLLWSTEAYDLQIDWWAQNLDRMNLGIGFVKEWYDSSIILIAKELPEEISDDVRWFNWTRPYDTRVWLMTIFTIFISGIVYQILEWYADDRQDRSMWQWWQENFYLSSINFTQAYEYQPKTFSSRLFGISMAIWALVMTATYTANLASLLVDRKPPPVVAQTIDEVAVFGNKICTWDGTWSDDYVRLNHPGAVRIPKQTVIEMYKGLHNGECEYAAEAVASWNKLKSLKEYNPYCDLYWVGGDRRAFEVNAGFVHKIDAGDKCTGLIRDVLDLHMQEMIEDGFLANAWDREYKRTADINCNTYRPELAAVIEEQLNGNSTAEEEEGDMVEDGSRRKRQRNLRRCSSTTNTNPQDNAAAAAAAATNRRRRLLHAQQYHRHLKASSKGAAGGAVAVFGESDDEGDAQKLTLEQMIGTFAFHWGIMIIALILANINALYVRHGEKHAKKAVNKMSQSFRDNLGASLRNFSDNLKQETTRLGSSTKHEHEDDISFADEPPSPFTTNSNDGSISGRAPGMESAPPKDKLQAQLDTMRQSQTNIEQSQSKMEEHQLQMQRAQLEMLQEQQRLQAQIQALLEAHGVRSVDSATLKNNTIVVSDNSSRRARVPRSASGNALNLFKSDDSVVSYDL